MILTADQQIDTLDRSKIAMQGYCVCVKLIHVRKDTTDR